MRQPVHSERVPPESRGIETRQTTEAAKAHFKVLITLLLHFKSCNTKGPFFLLDQMPHNEPERSFLWPQCAFSATFILSGHLQRHFSEASRPCFGSTRLRSLGLVHVPSSPSRMFGGGISMTFFNTRGKELGAPAAVCSVMTTGSLDIFLPCCYPRTNLTGFKKEKKRKGELSSCSETLTLDIKSVKPSSQRGSMVHLHPQRLRSPVRGTLRKSRSFAGLVFGTICTSFTKKNKKCPLRLVLIGESGPRFMNMN